tara:strand:- start:136 stop:507 length:372 start_codon:yes stop_codon:yes gene_type:complete
MTLTFEQIEKTVNVREIAESSQSFLKWAEENKKSPANFCDWGEFIVEFYTKQGKEWDEPVAINTPYGYEIFYPPKPKIEELKPIGCENDGDFDLDLFLDDSDDDDLDFETHAGHTSDGVEHHK